MEKKKAELKLLDMEHNLAGDNAEAYAKKYDRTLLLLKKRAQGAVDEGMEQTEYAKAQALLEALNQETTKPNDPNQEGEETPTPDGAPQTAEASGNETNWNQQVMVPRSLPAGGGIGPRTDAAGRGKMLEEAGGNDQSEDAVAMGLAWIARHQQFDPEKKYFGSWNFDLSRYGTPKSGEATSRVAATSLALLALLGHGNTREVGEYHKAVQDGI